MYSLRKNRVRKWLVSSFTIRPLLNEYKQMKHIPTKYFYRQIFFRSSYSNPQYDKRLFIELQVQYIKITCSEHVVYINCSECQNKNKNKQLMYTTCSELVIFMYWTCNSMNNLLSNCGLVDLRILKWFWQRFTCTVVGASN